jgi:hypothetical protein
MSARIRFPETVFFAGLAAEACSVFYDPAARGSNPAMSNVQIGVASGIILFSTPITPYFIEDIPTYWDRNTQSPSTRIFKKLSFTVPANAVFITISASYNVAGNPNVQIEYRTYLVQFTSYEFTTRSDGGQNRFKVIVELGSLPSNVFPQDILETFDLEGIGTRQLGSRTIEQGFKNFIYTASLDMSFAVKETPLIGTSFELFKSVIRGIRFLKNDVLIFSGSADDASFKYDAANGRISVRFLSAATSKMQQSIKNRAGRFNDGFFDRIGLFPYVKFNLYKFTVRSFLSRIADFLLANTLPPSLSFFEQLERVELSLILNPGPSSADAAAGLSLQNGLAFTENYMLDGSKTVADMLKKVAFIFNSQMGIDSDGVLFFRPIIRFKQFSSQVLFLNDDDVVSYVSREVVSAKKDRVAFTGNTHAGQSFSNPPQSGRIICESAPLAEPLRRNKTVFGNVTEEEYRLAQSGSNGTVIKKDDILGFGDDDIIDTPFRLETGLIAVGGNNFNPLNLPDYFVHFFRASDLNDPTIYETVATGFTLQGGYLDDVAPEPKSSLPHIMAATEWWFRRENRDFLTVTLRGTNWFMREDYIVRDGSRLASKGTRLRPVYMSIDDVADETEVVFLTLGKIALP